MPSPDLEANQAADRSFIIGDSKHQHWRSDDQTILLHLFYHGRSIQRHDLIGLITRRCPRSSRVVSDSAYSGHNRHVCRG